MKGFCVFRGYVRLGWQVRLGPNIEFLRLIVAKVVFVNWVELGLGGGGGVGWSEVGVKTRFFGSSASSHGARGVFEGPPRCEFWCKSGFTG